MEILRCFPSGRFPCVHPQILPPSDPLEVIPRTFVFSLPETASTKISKSSFLVFLFFSFPLHTSPLPNFHTLLYCISASLFNSLFHHQPAHCKWPDLLTRAIVTALASTSDRSIRSFLPSIFLTPPHRDPPPTFFDKIPLVWSLLPAISNCERRILLHTFYQSRR